MDFGPERAIDLDAKDPLRNLRAEFIVPTRADLKSKTLARLGRVFFLHPDLAAQDTYW